VLGTFSTAVDIGHVRVWRDASLGQAILAICSSSSIVKILSRTGTSIGDLLKEKFGTPIELSARAGVGTGDACKDRVVSQEKVMVAMAK
jgi:hypothetical protein